MVPFPLRWTSDAMGIECMIFLSQDNMAWGKKSCRTLSLMFVTEGSWAKPPRTVKPPFHDANYTSCLSRWGGQLAFLGNVSWCSEGQSFEGMNNHSALTMAREDIWCCEGPLLETLPASWSGICTLVQLAILFTLAFRHSDPSLKQTNHRAKRNTLAPGGSFDIYIYIFYWGP